MPFFKTILASEMQPWLDIGWVHDGVFHWQLSCRQYQVCLEWPHPREPRMPMLQPEPVSITKRERDALLTTIASEPIARLMYKCGSAARRAYLALVEELVGEVRPILR